MIKYLVFLLILIVAGEEAYVLGYREGAERPLSGIEKRNIAIDYACSPEQNWRMMKLFCGSIPKSERGSK